MGARPVQPVITDCRIRGVLHPPGFSPHAGVALDFLLGLRSHVHIAYTPVPLDRGPVHFTGSNGCVTFIAGSLVALAQDRQTSQLLEKPAFMRKSRPRDGTRLSLELAGSPGLRAHNLQSGCASGSLELPRRFGSQHYAHFVISAAISPLGFTHQGGLLALPLRVLLKQGWVFLFSPNRGSGQGPDRRRARQA